MKKIIITAIIATLLTMSACSSNGTADVSVSYASPDVTSASTTVDEDLVLMGSRGIKTEYYNARFEIDGGVLYITLNSNGERLRTQIDGCTELMISPMTADGYAIYASLSLYDENGLKEQRYVGGKDRYFTRAEIEDAFGPLTETE